MANGIGGSSAARELAEIQPWAKVAPPPGADEFAARLERLSPAELHALQAGWHAAQARGLQAWFARSGAAEVVDTSWPVRPGLAAAA